MGFDFFILFPSLIVFLFCVFLLSKDDFVLTRKNISLDSMFHLVFLVSLFALVASRLFWGILARNPSIINPLIFFAIPYVPGLSLAGAVGGGMASAWVIGRILKIGEGRVFDIVSLSFFASMSFIYMPFVLVRDVIFGLPFWMDGAQWVGGGAILILFFRLFLKERIKDGGIAFGSLGLFCLFVSWIKGSETIPLLALGVLFLALFFKEEHLVKKIVEILVEILKEKKKQ